MSEREGLQNDSRCNWDDLPAMDNTSKHSDDMARSRGGERKRRERTTEEQYEDLVCGLMPFRNENKEKENNKLWEIHCDTGTEMRLVCSRLKLM